VTVELTTPGHPLRFLVPLTLALLPAFTDLMTSVNNDVGAVAFFSLYLWGAVRLIQRGFSGLELMWTLGAMAVCLWVKPSVYVTFPLTIIVILILFFRDRPKWMAGGFLLLGIGIGILSVFSWGDAAYWHRATSQSSHIRGSHARAPLGMHVLQVETFPDITPAWLAPVYQPLPLETAKEVKGRSVTFGAWIWADKSSRVRTPILHINRNSFFKWVEVGVNPTFFALTAEVPPEAGRLWVTLEPLSRTSESKTTVYYDGIVLASGKQPQNVPPNYADMEGIRGTWGGEKFHNLIRNPSAERAWPRIRPWLDSLSARLLPDRTRFSSIMASWLDLSSTGWFYRLTIERLVRTFWAKFAWGHVPLLGHKPYRLLASITLLGVIGSVVAYWRKRTGLTWEVAIFLGLVLLLFWGMTIVRGAIYVALPRVYIPVARYAYPAIVPTTLLLTAGWWGILSVGKDFIRIPDGLLVLIYGLAFVGLDVISLISIARYYYG
jgi:hypothetical protein